MHSRAHFIYLRFAVMQTFNDTVSVCHWKNYGTVSMGEWNLNYHYKKKKKRWEEEEEAYVFRTAAVHC